MSQPKTEKKYSQKAKNLTARLVAVQIMYEHSQNPQNLDCILEQYFSGEKEFDIEEWEDIVPPDGVLLKKIVLGAEEQKDKLQKMVGHNYSKPVNALEPLLFSILQCGTYELLMHSDIDAPIIINDYLEIAHAYYEKGEVSLINGILDSVKKSARDVV